jgi:hypothetical protein
LRYFFNARSPPRKSFCVIFLTLRRDTRERIAAGLETRAGAAMDRSVNRSICMNRVSFSLLAASLMLAGILYADEKLPPGGKWPRHSLERPRPPEAAAQYDGEPVPAPEGATILFDGKDLTKWAGEKKGPNPSDAPRWKVENGYAQIVPGTGTLRTRDPIKGDFHLHIEWATPAEVKGNGQGRGNSGVFIGGFPEVQVLDSWENDTYPDGQAAALYGHSPPVVNVSRKPGEWQCYDIVVERARVENGKVVRRARITVRHNNVLVHDRVEFDNQDQEGGLSFQDHGNPIRFRNIWVKALPETTKE